MFARISQILGEMRAGRHFSTGVSLAIIILAVDRLSKWYLLYPFDLANRGVVEVTSFLNIVLVWNFGVSYGLFQANSWEERAVLIGFAALVVGALLIWMARVRDWLLVWAIGMVIGGAVGNLYDRVVYGAVADFLSFHAFGYYWYVFNVADVAIVLGVGLLIYDSLFTRGGET